MLADMIWVQFIPMQEVINRKVLSERANALIFAIDLRTE